MESHHSINSVDPFEIKTESWTLKGNFKLKRKEKKDRRPSPKLRRSALSPTASILHPRSDRFHVLRALLNSSGPVCVTLESRPCIQTAVREYSALPFPLRAFTPRDSRASVSCLCHCQHLTRRCFLCEVMATGSPTAPGNGRLSSACHQCPLSLLPSEVGAQTQVGQKGKQPVWRHKVAELL